MKAHRSPHTFHIPVLGTGFTIDSPMKVARYGISSVISLVDDILIEQLRKHHCERLGLPYVEITRDNIDARANRITAYLNLLDKTVRDQVVQLQSAPFEPGSEITRYFEMIPESPLRESYTRMLATTDPAEKLKLQSDLRDRAVPGSIDVNIMTKVDRDTYRGDMKLPKERADAMAALRGFANSSLDSSVVFSAGINRRLYGYAAEFEDFFPDESDNLRKRIILKVSDFRSAMIQGKFLAKRGLWISEYRIESGLNCGGHAFATEGFLLGPILDEFYNKKSELVESLHDEYNKALSNMKRPSVKAPFDVRLTVQGGIGTARENEFLHEHFRVDGTGWGTPFLLVPEATNVDDAHIQKLICAEEGDVYLSDQSPLGVPFWSLRNSASEEIRDRRVESGRPGSPCAKGFLTFDSEFTHVPICHASRSFQKRKLAQLDESTASAKHTEFQRAAVLTKSCLCHDLAGGATLKYGIDRDARPAVCCGPNIVSFGNTMSLETIVGHIYGRLSALTSDNRPHMFIRELEIYIDYLQRELQKAADGFISKTVESFIEFKNRLASAVDYYENLADKLIPEEKERFLQGLKHLSEKIEMILPAAPSVLSPGLTA